MILNGYSYFKNNRSEDRTYWLCSRNRYGKCKARIITMNLTRAVIVKNQNHNHAPEPPGEINTLEEISFDAAMKIINEGIEINETC